MVRERPGSYRISDLPESERPRERLERLGAQSLPDAELLAILLRVGVAGENVVEVGGRLLHDLGGLRGIHMASFVDLCHQHGIGQAKAAQIKAAIELGRRLTVVAPEERPVVHSPEDAAALVQFEMSGLTQEHLWVLNLDTRNRVINIEKLYAGSLNASSVRVGEVFKSGIQRNAASIVVFHNHPSGDPSPSPEDITLTRALVEAGKLLDISVLDHLVIGAGRWVSLKQKGVTFS